MSFNNNLTTFLFLKKKQNNSLKIDRLERRRSIVDGKIWPNHSNDKPNQKKIDDQLVQIILYFLNKLSLEHIQNWKTNDKHQFNLDEYLSLDLLVFWKLNDQKQNYIDAIQDLLYFDMKVYGKLSKNTKKKFKKMFHIFGITKLDQYLV